MNNFSNNQIANIFSSLAHPKRVEIFNVLLERGHEPMSFGSLQKQTGIPASTLSHHLNEMGLGLILIKQSSGTSTNLKLDLSYLQNVLSQLLDSCCKSTFAKKDIDNE